MRHVPVILAFLVLGAIVTVAIAWLCAAYVRPGLTSMSAVTVRTLPDLTKETVAVQRGFGHSRVTTIYGNLTINADGFYFNDDDAVTRRGRGFGPRPAPSEVMLGGWPFRALSCESRNHVTLRTETGWLALAGGMPGMADDVEGGIVLNPQSPLGWRALPYRPVWLGLFLDAVLSGAALWCLFLALPRRWRRRRRAKRGLCIACGYDLRGHDHAACPECGQVDLRPRS